MSFPSSASQSSSSQGQTIPLSEFLARNDDHNFVWDDIDREESAAWLGPVEAARLDRAKHKVFKHRSKEYLRPPSPFVQQGAELGDSGSTVVYRATAPEGYLYRRPLAVKIIICKEHTRPPGPDSKARMDALKEVKTMSMLRHPHIVAYVASFEEYCLQSREIRRKTKSRAFGKDQDQAAESGKMDPRIKKHILGIAMYPPAQCNLHGFMDEVFQKPSNAEWIIQQMHNFFGCLGQAVAYLHRQGIQVRHKDIKPENIVIDDFGAPLLTDFGLSKHFEVGQHSEGPTPKTLKYADPEAVQESRRDERSDIFSLGCVFLEMATVLLGRPATFAEEQLAASSADDDRHSISSRSPYFMYSESLRNLDAYLTTLNIIAQDCAAQKTGTRDPEAVLAILPHIRRMMDESVARRPQAHQLYPWFRHLSDVYVFPGPCKNCERERRTGKAISQSGSRSGSTSGSTSCNGSPTVNRVGTGNGSGGGFGGSAPSSQRLVRIPTMTRIASFPHSQP
ncbi:hypothetical protein VTJ83DRAFT_5571 [Remersonia thermophila]|uniref:non-specific serine/threonine protein kinase n=1 Tax=Remersonia thermophila TaxID=72144 RepID=A0ABR4D9E9_9PEZI